LIFFWRFGKGVGLTIPIDRFQGVSVRHAFNWLSSYILSKWTNQKYNKYEKKLILQTVVKMILFRF